MTLKHNNCHFCGNNIPPDSETCMQAGYACDGPLTHPKETPSGFVEKMQERIDPHNVRAGDVHYRLFNAVTKAQLAVSKEEMFETRIEVFDSVKEIIADTITAFHKEVERVVEGEKGKIISKEPSDIGQWSETGKVAYYYLDSVATKLKEIM